MRTLVVAAAIMVAFSVQTAFGICNSEDGNITRFSAPNYDAVLYGEVGVCRVGQYLPVNVVQQGRDAWSTVAAKPLMSSACNYTGVVVVDVPNGDCGADRIACSNFPWGEEPSMIRVRIEADAAGYDEVDQRYIITHELGHAMGFDEATVCESVMNSADCAYDYPSPMPWDEANYYEGYHVEPVTNLQGSSESPGDVFLAWNQVNDQGELLCNEAGFSVLRGAEVGSVDKDGTSIDLSEQPPGLQTYTVRSWTRALAGPQGEDDTTVDVDGEPYVEANFLFGPAPVPLSSEQGRFLWGIGELINPTGHDMEVDFRTWISGSRVSGCQELQQLILPGWEERTWIYAGEPRWVIYRWRFECHSPATSTVRDWKVHLCVSEVGESAEDCHEGNRTFIVD